MAEGNNFFKQLGDSALGIIDNFSGKAGQDLQMRQFDNKEDYIAFMNYESQLSQESTMKLLTVVMVIGVIVSVGYFATRRSKK